MTKADEIRIKKLIQHLSLKYNVNADEIKEIVDSPYLFTKEKMKELDLRNIIEEKEWDSVKGTFMYRSFGRLYPNFKLFLRNQKQKANINRINNKKWRK